MKARSTYVAWHIKIKIASHQVTLEKLARLLRTIVEKVFFRLKSSFMIHTSVQLIVVTSCLISGQVSYVCLSTTGFYIR